MMHARHNARNAIFAAAIAYGRGHRPLPPTLFKATVGQRGNWDTSVCYLGEKAGIFKKHGIELEILYTSGSGETLQPVIAGSARPRLRSRHSRRHGGLRKARAGTHHWRRSYRRSRLLVRQGVIADQDAADTNGHTIAFSTNGSSTQSIVRAFIDEFKLTAKPTATGNPSATLTAVMTDQVDVGWASPPFGLKEQKPDKFTSSPRPRTPRSCAARPSA